MAIWHTARFDAEDRKGYGWLGRALDPSAGNLFAVGGEVPTALRGRRSTAVAFTRIEQVLLSDPAAAKHGVGTESTDELLAFVRRQAVDSYAAADKLTKLVGDTGGPSYPSSALGEKLKLVSRLMKADVGARVYYAQQSGYDTHSQQPFAHAKLLGEFARAVSAFFADLKESRLTDQVALLAFSEFGRTIKENGSAGTDHGTAGCVFVAGAGVKGGVHGTSPSLTDLVGGEPKMTTDFRAVYASTLSDWLGLSPQHIGGAGASLNVFG
jgi:uncharacterized protein (DUF1501 family)